MCNLKRLYTYLILYVSRMQDYAYDYIKNHSLVGLGEQSLNIGMRITSHVCECP